MNLVKKFKIHARILKKKINNKHSFLHKLTKVDYSKSKVIHALDYTLDYGKTNINEKYQEKSENIIS